jgi:signal transduction histidine kinase
MSANHHDGEEWSHYAQIREEERARIAREVHDELGQLLTGIKIEAYLVTNFVRNEDPVVKAHLSRMTSLVNQMVKAVDRIGTELRSSILRRLGLKAAIQWQAKEFEVRTGIKSNVAVGGSVKVDEKRSLNIFRLYQEALTNVARHANASLVATVFQVQDGVLSLTIVDNGCGFDPEKAKMDGALGLIGMKERAEIVGGELLIESGSGKGTAIRLTIPIGRERHVFD